MGSKKISTVISILWLKKHRQKLSDLPIAMLCINVSARTKIYEFLFPTKNAKIHTAF